MKKKTAYLDHINLSVKNFEETVQWYKDVFDFELVEQGTRFGRRWGILKNGDSMICFGEAPKKKELTDEVYEEYHGINHFGLRITDRKAWEDTVKKYSIKTYYASPVNYPHSTSWYILDPTGHEIEVALWDNDEVRFG